MTDKPMEQAPVKKKKKKKKRNWPFVLIFLIGALVLAYPHISDLYYRVETRSLISEFKEESAKISPEELAERLSLARAYNESLYNAITEDPYSENKLAEGRAEYARMLEVKEKLGHVEIPKININIPMYAGTSDQVLEMGAGHLEGTSLPIGGNSTHSVITAHTGLPKAKLFTDLNKLEIGDKFYIHNIEGVLAYQVDQVLVIEPTDFKDLLIEPGHDYVTLLTCTPIMVNSHRLIVRGHRVDYVPAVDEASIAEHAASFMYMYLFYAAIALIVLLLLLLLYLRSKQKKIEKQLRTLKKQQEPLEKTDAD